MRKKTFLCIVTAIAFFSVFLDLKATAQEHTVWNSKTAGEWFKKREWLNDGKAAEKQRKYDAFGREVQSDDSATTAPATGIPRTLTPHKSIDKIEFAKQYHANKKWWDEAFTFLKTADLAAIKPGRYAIDGNNVYATVFEGTPKFKDTVKWESHRNFEDIHYVFTGEEQIGIAPVVSSKVVTPYDSARDIAYYSAAGVYYPLLPGTFFIAFTQHAHRPGLKVDGHDNVKHVVVKVRKAL